MSKQKQDESSRQAESAPAAALSPLVQRHMRIGWWSLLLFLTFGIALEVMHAFKVGYYLSVANETRRMLFTLAHAHGVLLALVNIAFAATLKIYGDAEQKWQRLASRSLMGATVLLPGGFLLGGLVIYAGDPGKGILLVPLGAALLFLAVLLTARRTSR